MWLECFKGLKQLLARLLLIIIGIPPGFCTHKIQLEEDGTPIIEHRRRLNLHMQEVVKKKIIN